MEEKKTLDEVLSADSAPEISEEVVEDAQKKMDEAREQAQKEQEERMEKIVVIAREKLLPYLKGLNVSVNESKMAVEALAVTIQQGLFLLMKTTDVAELNLRDKINENYPNYEKFVALIELMNPEKMEYAIEALQWMGKKIEATLNAENKERSFEDLGLDF